AMKKELWQPGEIQPQCPAVTEIDDRYGPHALHQRPPWHRLLQLRFSCRVIGKDREFLRRNPGVLFGIISEVKPPDHDPHQAHHAKYNKGSSPGTDLDQPRHQRRRKKVSQSCKRVRETLRE